MERRCSVCGFESEEAVCPRCGTILLRGQAICPKCGKLFPGWIAACDRCGTSLGPRPAGPVDEEAVRLMASIPGIDEAHARALVAKGFRDFSDVVRLALPESEVKKGLHHAIARRALLADIPRDAGSGEAAVACPVCGSPWPAGQDRCRVCGSAAVRDRPDETVQEEMARVADEIVAVSDAAEVDHMPTAVRDEILDAFVTEDPQDALRQEYRRQIEAWHGKGFVVDALEALLEEDLDAFRERSVRMIRAQMLKKVARGEFRCPLCEAVLAPEAEECENCGAKFA